MTEGEARHEYEAYCVRMHRKPSARWSESLEDGSWLFVEVKEEGQPSPGSYEGVAVRAQGGVFRFAGGLGKVFRCYAAELGAPASEERFLGVTAQGTYQAFDHGVAIWEAKENFAYPLVESLSSLPSQMCVVAFLDLRSFTSWSDKKPEEVQRAVQTLESAVQDGFSGKAPPWKHLFLKGTGDGVMIVSQADWYRSDTDGKHLSKLVPGHAKDFLCACRRAVDFGAERLKHYGYPLAVGCGIAVGELNRVFLFGRLDFVGPAANEAAKLQQHAWNEVCITRDFGAILKEEGTRLDSEWELPAKGWRLHPATPVELQAPGEAVSDLEPRLAQRLARRWSHICRRFRLMER